MAGKDVHLPNESRTIDSRLPNAQVRQLALDRGQTIPRDWKPPARWMKRSPAERREMRGKR